MDNIAQMRKSYQKYVLCHSVALNYNYHHTKTSRLIAKKNANKCFVDKGLNTYSSTRFRTYCIFIWIYNSSAHNTGEDELIRILLKGKYRYSQKL